METKTKPDDCAFSNDGLSKREEFAKAAMQGFCACQGVFEEWGLERIAVESVKQADALIKALNQ